jgi:hypothetical protein
VGKVEAKGGEGGGGRRAGWSDGWGGAEGVNKESGEAVGVEPVLIAQFAFCALPS